MTIFHRPQIKKVSGTLNNELSKAYTDRQIKDVIEAMSDSERRQLIKDIREKYDIELDASDPSLVAFYIFSRMFEKYHKSLTSIENVRNHEIARIEGVIETLKEDLNAFEQEALEQIFNETNNGIEKKYGNLHSEVIKAEQKAANAALEKVSSFVEGETTQMIEDLREVGTEITKVNLEIRKKEMKLYIAGAFILGVCIAVMLSMLYIHIRY